MSQLDILQYLIDEGPATKREITEHLHTKGMTRYSGQYLKKLNADGFVRLRDDGSYEFVKAGHWEAGLR